MQYQKATQELQTKTDKNMELYLHHFKKADEYNIKLRNLVGKPYTNVAERNTLSMKMQSLLQEDKQYQTMLDGINTTTKPQHILSPSVRGERDSLKDKLNTIKTSIVNTHHDLESLE